MGNLIFEAKTCCTLAMTLMVSEDKLLAVCLYIHTNTTTSTTTNNNKIQHIVEYVICCNQNTFSYLQLIMTVLYMFFSQSFGNRVSCRPTTFLSHSELCYDFLA